MTSIKGFRLRGLRIPTVRRATVFASKPTIPRPRLNAGYGSEEVLGAELPNPGVLPGNRKEAGAPHAPCAQASSARLTPDSMASRRWRSSERFRDSEWIFSPKLSLT